MLTYVLANWMIHFYSSANHAAAATCKELLLVLAGGTLGWIAKRKGG